MIKAALKALMKFRQTAGRWLAVRRSQSYPPIDEMLEQVKAREAERSAQLRAKLGDAAYDEYEAERQQEQDAHHARLRAVQIEPKYLNGADYLHLSPALREAIGFQRLELILARIKAEADREPASPVDTSFLGEPPETEAIEEELDE